MTERGTIRAVRERKERDAYRIVPVLVPIPRLYRPSVLPTVTSGPYETSGTR